MTTVGVDAFYNYRLYYYSKLKKKKTIKNKRFARNSNIF